MISDRADLTYEETKQEMKYLKLILFAGLLLTNITCYASYVKCYRGEKIIWEGWASHIWIQKDSIIFRNIDGKRMYIPEKCIVTSDNSNTWG